MNFGIITMKKISGSLRGIQNHIFREGKSRSNPDIDAARSSENFSLIEEDLRSLEERLKDRVSKLKGQKTKTGKTRKIQKNAVKLCDFVVTMSPDELAKLEPLDRDMYFDECRQWLENRYGKENIIYAQVHLDEATPHLHVGVVPVIHDKLCAKELFTKKEMKSLQEGFYRDVSAPRGLDKPLGGRKGLSVLRFKAEQARKAGQRIFEDAPQRVQNYLHDMIREVVDAEALQGNKDAQATLQYLQEYDDFKEGPWAWLSESEKDRLRFEKEKADYR